jgi:hypothetical protein
MRTLASVLATGVVALGLAAQAGACSTGDPAWSPDGLVTIPSRGVE